MQRHVRDLHVAVAADVPRCYAAAAAAFSGSDELPPTPSYPIEWFSEFVVFHTKLALTTRLKERVDVIDKKLIRC